MVFRLLSKGSYVLDDNSTLIEEAEKIMKQITGNIVTPELLDKQLLNTILSRMIAREFYKQGNDVTESQPYVTVKTVVHNNVHVTTIGKLIVDNKEEILNGVLQVS